MDGNPPDTKMSLKNKTKQKASCSPNPEARDEEDLLGQQ